MCVDCWNQAGQPANWTPEIAKTLGLVRELYAIHPTGGPLHVALDDWNVEGDIKPYYLDEADENAREVCDQIAAKLNAMTLKDRYSVLAYHGRYAEPPAAQ
jgi:hypothetical protein